MGDSIEILFTSDSNGTHFTSSAWDAKTGTNLMSYKGGGAANAHGLCLIKNEFLASANSTKPLIHIWPLNSQDQISNIRFVAPGKPNALAISPDGNFLVAGIQETVYIWEICSGTMLGSLAKHYQSITAIKFTDDGSHFITAGLDGCVLVWNLTKAIGQKDSSYLPLYTFNDHALPLTDLHVGIGGIRAIMCSVSTDRSCKLYDLATGTLLLNIVFNEPLSSVCVNVLETMVFVGAASGAIYQFNIGSAPRTKEYHLTPEDYSNKFIGHQGAVTCLVLSLDGTTLVSGGQDENIYMWHIPSRQILRTIPHKGQITNIVYLLSSRNLFNLENKYNLIASNIKRMMTSTTGDSEVVEILINESIDNDDLRETSFEDVQPMTHIQPIAGNSQETQTLRNEVERLKLINKELFNYSVKNILSST